tara:strand:- start:204 stop:1280 length:1077 start_codon:yes stop_codon:yes gene_type:complete
MSVFDEFLDIFGFGDSETPAIEGGPKYDNKPNKSKKKGGTELNNEINDFLKKDPAERSLKDFYSLLGDISRTDRPTFLNPTKERLLVALNAQFPNRAAGDNKSERDALRSPKFEGFTDDPKYVSQIKGTKPGDIVPKPFEESDVTLAVARGELTKDIKEQLDKANQPYEGPFGKLGEYFSKNADKREELFDYISSIGQQLVRPTNPGEARGFLSDVSAGLGAGEAKIASKAAAETEADYKRALSAQAMRPKTTTAYDNAVAIVEGQGKFKKGSPEFASAVAKMLTFITASPALTSLNDQLSDLQTKLKLAQGDDVEMARIANQIASVRAQINSLTGTSSAGGSESAVAVYDNTKNKKN